MQTVVQALVATALRSLIILHIFFVLFLGMSRLAFKLSNLLPKFSPGLCGALPPPIPFLDFMGFHALIPSDSFLRFNSDFYVVIWAPTVSDPKFSYIIWFLLSMWLPTPEPSWFLLCMCLAKISTAIFIPALVTPAND